MGGDHGPSVIIPALTKVAKRRTDVRFLIYGRVETVRARCSTSIRSSPPSASCIHCEVAVRMDDKPSQALRHGRWKSSMWKAIEAVKAGEADACVSAGNTGALMAMSKFCLRTMATIERPAIAAIWPTHARRKRRARRRRHDRRRRAPARSTSPFWAPPWRAPLFGIDRPTVGLLNVGVEEIKGQEEVKEAGRLLREADLMSMSYHGFVEGDDIGKGTVDVVVTEGFAGNIALKTAEGTARQIAGYLRAAMSRTLMARIGYVFAKGAFDRLREKMDVRKVNGGVFLGLNGIVVKSHGGTDDEGFAAADRTRLRHGPQPAARPHRGRSRPVPRASPASSARRTPRQTTTRNRTDMIRSVVRGIGSALPRRIMKNTDFEGMVETSDEWIVQRTGIRQRHIAADDETTASLGEARRARRARQCRPDARRYRPDRAGDLDARQHLSGHRGRTSRTGSACGTASPSTCRRCARGFVYAVDDRRPLHHAAAWPSACW